MNDQNNVVYLGSKQPVKVQTPCGFCGNNPPYMCADCNNLDDDVPDMDLETGSVLITGGRKWIGSGDSGWL